MAETLPYLVELDDAAVVVRFDRGFFDNDDLTDLLDYLRLKVIRKRSQLTDEQIATLAAEIKQSGWERIKGQFLGDLQ